MWNYKTLLFFIVIFQSCSDPIESVTNTTDSADPIFQNVPIIKHYPDTFLSLNRTPFILGLSFNYIKVGSRINYPQFPGGNDSASEIIGSHLRINTTLSKKDSLRGEIDFTVDSDGSIKNAKISSSIDPELDSQLLKLVSEFKLIPATKVETGKLISRPGQLEIKIKFFKNKNDNHF